MNNNDNRYSFSVTPELPPPPPKPPKKRGKGFLAFFLVCALLTGSAGGIGGYLLMDAVSPAETTLSADSGTTLPDSTANDDSATGDASPDASDQSQAAAKSPLTLTSQDGLSAMSIQDIFTAADPSTVAISTSASVQNVFGQRVENASAGSGFIITADGYIITNHHVIDGATKVTVMLGDGTEYPAEVIGGDESTDIAVLKIDAKNLKAVNIGNSDNITVGDQVIAIGNPLGELANSLTVGYVSAMERSVEIDGYTRPMLQSDVSVSPGNSGGPLLNIYGQVVGVISAKSVGDGVEGIAFAIPINKAADIANQLIENGYVKGRPYLGVTVTPSSTQYNMPAGVFVASVTEGGPADQAGLQTNDVILTFGGVDVTTNSELLAELGRYNAGDAVDVVISRNGTKQTLRITLGEMTPDKTQAQTEQSVTPNQDNQDEQTNPYYNFPWGNRMP